MNTLFSRGNADDDLIFRDTIGFESLHEPTRFSNNLVRNCIFLDDYECEMRAGIVLEKCPAVFSELVEIIKLVMKLQR